MLALASLKTKEINTHIIVYVKMDSQLSSFQNLLKYLWGLFWKIKRLTVHLHIHTYYILANLSNIFYGYFQWSGRVIQCIGLVRYYQDILHTFQYLKGILATVRIPLPNIWKWHIKTNIWISASTYIYTVAIKKRIRKVVSKLAKASIY